MIPGLPPRFDPLPAPPLLRFEVRGLPTPAGSKTAMPIYRGSGDAKVFTGKHTMVDGSVSPTAKQARKDWRGAVLDAVVAAMDAAPQHEYPLNFPLAVWMVFTMPRPASHYGSGRNANQVRDSAPHAPMGKPDTIKLCRAVEDMITSARCWRDDARIVTYDRLAKVYPREGIGAMDYPGVRVIIRADIPTRSITQEAML